MIFPPYSDVRMQSTSTCVLKDAAAPDVLSLRVMSTVIDPLLPMDALLKYHRYDAVATPIAHSAVHPVPMADCTCAAVRVALL